MTRLNDRLVSFALAFSAGIVFTLSPTRVDAAQGQRPAARASARTNINALHTRPAASSRSVAKPAAAGSRAQTGSSVARDRVATVSRNNTRNVNRDINRDHNVNVNQNLNVSHDINVNHDVEVHHHDHDHWDDWDDHPFAVAAAVTTGVAVTSAIIGSIVYTVPPSCVQVIVNNMAYQQCGNTWYLPQYSGTTVQYVVVVPPR